MGVLPNLEAQAAERTRLQRLIPDANQETRSAGAKHCPDSESTSLLSGNHPKDGGASCVLIMCFCFFAIAFGVPLGLAGTGLVFTFLADPAKDFRVVDGACKISRVTSERSTWAHDDDTEVSCHDSYTYSYCIDENFKTYSAGTSPIELCSACTGSEKHNCAEGEDTYWSCIASLPCMLNAKWNQHTQLNVTRHFDCHLATQGLSAEHACEGNGYDKAACAGVGCCRLAECPIGDGSGECHGASSGDCVDIEFKSRIVELPSCKKPNHRLLAKSNCFGSMTDSKEVCARDCSACKSRNTTASFAEGEEVTCWAPAPGTTPGFPYECEKGPNFDNPECFKTHE